MDHDADMTYYVASCLKILLVHGQCLNNVYSTHPQQVEQFLKQQFIPKYEHMVDSSVNTLHSALYVITKCTNNFIIEFNFYLTSIFIM